MAKPIFTEIQSKKLKKLGILNSFDLLLHLPLRYIDETKIELIKNITPGLMYQVEAKIISIEVSYRPRKNLTVYVKDISGDLKLRFMNFYPSQIKEFEEGKIIRIYGEIKLNTFLFEMIHPKYEFVSIDTPLKNFYTPIYPTTEGLSQKLIFKLVQKVFEQEDLERQNPDYFGSLYQKKSLPFIISRGSFGTGPSKYPFRFFDCRLNFSS